MGRGAIAVGALVSVGLALPACADDVDRNGTGGAAAGTPTGTGVGGTGGTGGIGGTGGQGATGGSVVSDCGAATLADEASSMAAGTFSQLSAPGYDAALIDAGAGHHILQYSDKAAWDPTTCQVLFVGGGHLSQVKYIAYSASSDLWFQAPNPSWWCDTFAATNPYECATHAYGHNALDPARGELYFRKFNSSIVYRHEVDATLDADWTEIPELPSSAAGCIATGIEFFPDRDQLVYVDCQSQGLLTWSPGDAAWQTIDGPFAMGAYHNYAVYNPVHQVVIFGGGNDSSDLHLLDASGVVTTAANAPATFHPAPQDDTTLKILTVDPATGHYLAYATGGQLHQYDVGANTWSAVGVTAPTNLDLAVPITNYGVVLFIGQGPEAIYLYKHGG